MILSTTEGLGGSANLSYHGLSINREVDAMVPASLLPAAWAWAEALWGLGTWQAREAQVLRCERRG